MMRARVAAAAAAMLLFHPALTHLDVSGYRLKRLPGTISLLEHLSYLSACNNLWLTRVSPRIGLLTTLLNFELKNCKNCPRLRHAAMLDTLVSNRTKSSDILGECYMNKS